jgi:hypothetical protein
MAAPNQRGHRRQRKNLRALIPEALPAARVGIIPAEAGLGRRAGPGGGGRRSDETDGRPRGHRSARRPAIPGRPRPDGSAVSVAGPVGWRAVARAISRTAGMVAGAMARSPRAIARSAGSPWPVSGRTIRPAAPSSTPIAAPMPSRRLPYETGVQMPGRDRRHDDFDCFRLRNCERPERQNNDRAFDRAGLPHGLSSRRPYAGGQEARTAPRPDARPFDPGARVRERASARLR